jgi:hypothetical protein
MRYAPLSREGVRPIVRTQLPSRGRTNNLPPGRPNGTLFESRFSHDFSEVRVHADAKVNAAAERVEQVALATSGATGLPILRRKKAGGGKVPNGEFNFEMEKEKRGPKENVHITFSPDAKGPQTKAIKFLQIVRVTDPKGKTIPWGTLHPEEAIKERLGPQRTEDKVHQTRSGDTLASIALQHYASEENALKIFAANSQILNIPRQRGAPKMSPGEINGAAGPATVNGSEPSGQELPTPDINFPLPAGLRLTIPGAVQKDFMVDIDPIGK